MEKIPEKILEAFSKIEINQCTICGKFLSKKEFEESEGVCLTHWDE